MKAKRAKKQRLQKIFVIILLVLVVTMGGYQVNEYFVNGKKAEDITYTAAVFKVPMQQSIEVLMISASDDKASVIDNQSNKIQYSDIKNYKEENLKRYGEYHALYPELLDAEVIWRVNTNLDYDFYTNVSEVEDPLSIIAVVNKYYYLERDFEPEDLVLVENEAEKLYLREEAKAAYLEMKEAMKKQDLKINLSSAYRSYNTQEKLYNEEVEKNGKEMADINIARPGHSEHQLGLVIDVNSGSVPFEPFGKTASYTWVKDNAHRFGYIIRYKGNPELTGYQVEEWHLRYVGKDVAIDMYESNISVLEEFLDKRGL